jgi:hypothetical protein
MSENMHMLLLQKYSKDLRNYQNFGFRSHSAMFSVIFTGTFYYFAACGEDIIVCQISLERKFVLVSS